MSVTTVHMRPRISLAGRTIGFPLFEQVGYDSFRRPIPLPQHTHQGIEITYIGKGEVTWVVEGRRSLHLVGGDMATVLPGRSHAGEWDSIRPCTLYWFVFNPRLPGACRNTPFSPQDLTALTRCVTHGGDRIVEAPQLARRFEEMHSCMLRHADYYDDTTAARLRAVLSHLLVDVCDSFAIDRTRALLPQIRRAMDFMNARLEEPVAVAQVARYVSLSPSRLHALFRRETGQTPADYLRRARCAAARRALLDTNASVTDIAMRFGFSSSQHFARAFRSYAGVSPSEARITEGAPRLSRPLNCEGQARPEAPGSDRRD